MRSVIAIVVVLSPLMAGCFDAAGVEETEDTLTGGEDTRLPPSDTSEEVDATSKDTAEEVDTTPIPTGCEEAVAKCPAGTAARAQGVENTQCLDKDDEGYVTDNSGTTGTCTFAGSCQIFCAFPDVCECGVEKITSEGVFCNPSSDCVGACGDDLCTPGEGVNTCPIDCITGVCQRSDLPSQRTCTELSDCNPDEICDLDGFCVPPARKRCNGNAIQTCAFKVGGDLPEGYGKWDTPFECPEGQVCQQESELVATCVSGG